MADFEQRSEGYKKMHAEVQRAETFEAIHRLDGWVDTLADEALRRSKELLGEPTKELLSSDRDEPVPSRDPK